MTAAELRAYCRATNLTFKELARSLDLSERTVRRYARGEWPIPRTVELALDALEAEADFAR